MSGFESAKNAVSGGLDALRGFFPFSPATYGPFSGRGYTTYSGLALMGDFGKSISGAASRTAAMASKAMGTVRDALLSEPVSMSATASIAPSSLRSSVAIDAGGSGSGDVISWLASNLPAIIAECTPTVGERDFARMARKAVANG